MTYEEMSNYELLAQYKWAIMNGAGQDIHDIEEELYERLGGVGE